MSVRALNVHVELDIQAVTCPGVWLCPNGKIALKIFMFETSAKTSHLPPVFPLLYHQKLIFQKTFSNVRYLADLQHLFGKEFLHAELVQCSGSTGVVLASFETTVFELLYPSPCVKGLIAGVDVDLLMEPTSCFPGILAPKIEVSTKTIIESVDSPSHSKRNPGIINPKMLSSKGSPTFKRCQQKKMCNMKEQLSRSPKQKRKSVQSKRRCIKQKGGVCTAVPNSDENSDSCICCSSNAQDISLQQSKSAESVLESPACLPVWTSATGRIHSPQSYCNLFNDLEQDDEAKWRKAKRDCRCMKCHCPCQGENGKSHKACSCPVCSIYNVYFGRQFANHYSVKQGKRPQECPGNCCHCGSEKNRLKEAVHERIHTSLRLPSYFPFKRDIDDMISKCPCNISEQKQISNCGKYQYREEFYHDLEKFYKELHKRAKKKTSKED